MARRSIEKGKRGEREAAAELARLFRVEARRGRQYSGSPDSPDVQTAIPGVHCEVKRCERIRLYAALEQANKDAGGKVPLILHRANQKPWLAIVPLEDLPSLVVNLYLTLAQDGGRCCPEGADV